MEKYIHIHADDFGLCKEISDNILDCVNHGQINSVSIVCNTENFEYSIGNYKNLEKNIRLCLHLNLGEGSAVSKISDVDLLVDSKGEFKFLFVSLWLKYLFSTSNTKSKLRNQIKHEIENQIKLLKNAIGENVTLNIDSHMHVHLIPFILDIILDLSKQHKIEFIRTPYERKYFSLKTFKNYFSANILKNVLLNYLSKKAKRKLNNHHIKSNEFFIGILATGRMTNFDVISALKSIKNANSFDILFHPGGVKNKKSVTWTTKSAFKSYYSSQNRTFEANILKSEKFKMTIEKLKV